MRRLSLLLLLGLVTGCASSDPNTSGDDDDDTTDTTPPSVSQQVPASGGTEIPVTSTIVVTFDEDMDEASVIAALAVADGSGDIAGTVTWDAGSRSATFTPDADLANETEYDVTVSASATDAAGNALPAAVTWSFTTAAFGVRSSQLAEGANFDPDHTCAGLDVSPPLDWTASSGAQSYAIVLRDLDFQSGFLHWVIWDIPRGVTALPESVEEVAEPGTPAGAKQAQSFNGDQGYGGPCPNGNQHTYEFTVYALDVSTLPGVTTSDDMATVADAIDTHDLATTLLTGESDASP